MYTYNITNTVSITVVLRCPIMILSALLCYIRLLGLNQHCKDGLQKRIFYQILLLKFLPRCNVIRYFIFMCFILICVLSIPDSGMFYN